MKQLRNKKTGDISTNPLISVAPFTGGVRGCHIKTYRSAAEFNEEWEDVEDINVPIIKDEQIRKAVRAWAEVCGLSYVTYKQASNEFYDPDTRGAFAIRFRLIPVEVYLEDGECYTITELCGEEEE